jgi:ubiquinone biosynthesis protein
MTSSHHRREVQIAEVLARYEMGHLAEVFGLEGLVSLERRLLRRGPAHPRPENLRMALEELGPTFIKLGQALSTRPDLVPPDFRAELAKLQDDTRPVPTPVIEETIISELGVPASEAFASFDADPLAAASIGQVHAATLHDGADVVVKIRRPGAAEEVEQDLEILQNMAARASQRWKEARNFDLPGLAKDFADALRAELDYLAEAGNAKKFAANFAAYADVHIPVVYTELTTSRMITLERVRGTKISDIAELDATGVDRAAVAERLAQTVAKMVLEDGFYHADPHPGNFFVEAGGRVGIVDFGQVGRVSDDQLATLSRLLMAVIRRDPDRLTTVLVAFRVPTEPVNRGALRHDLAQLLSEYDGHALHELPIGRAITDVMGIVRRHNLIIDPDLALLFAVLVMDDSLAVELNADFTFDGALAPYVQRRLASNLSPSALARRAEHFGLELAELAEELPGQFRRLLEVVGEGQFEVHLRTNDLEPLVSRIERLGNRVAISILAAAVIDGLSELAAHNSRERGWRRPLLAAGVAAVTSVSAYTAWRRSPFASVLGKLRVPVRPAT